MSLVSHAIAVSVVIYYLIQSHLLNTIQLSTLTVKIMPPTFYVFLLIYLFIQMAVTVRTTCDDVKVLIRFVGGGHSTIICFMRGIGPK